MIRLLSMFDHPNGRSSSKSSGRGAALFQMKLHGNKISVANYRWEPDTIFGCSEDIGIRDGHWIVGMHKIKFIFRSKYRSTPDVF